MNVEKQVNMPISGMIAANGMPLTYCFLCSKLLLLDDKKQTKDTKLKFGDFPASSDKIVSSI